MNDFFRTMMGRTFFEGTLPNLVRELARLNDNLERDREQRERIHRERSGDPLDRPLNPPLGYSDGGPRG